MVNIDKMMASSFRIQLFIAYWLVLLSTQPCKASCKNAALQKVVDKL